MSVKAVIMAGGQGTRLRSVAADIPKPMVRILDKPVLQYQIENLRDNGITDIILITGYLGDCIRSYFGDGAALGVKLSYFTEDHPMGTAGALFYLKEQLTEDFLLLMGDLMLSVDFKRMLRAHREAGGSATLFVHPNSHPYDSDVIVTETVGRLSDYTAEADARRRARWAACDVGRCAENHTAAYNAQAANISDENVSAGNVSVGNVSAVKHKDCTALAGAHQDEADGFANRVCGVLGKKAERTGYYHNQVNAGIYVISSAVPAGMEQPKEWSVIESELAEAAQRGADETELKAIRKSGKIDLDKDVLRPLIEKGEVYAYHSTEYVKDMGTPDRYASVTADLKNGTVAARNLSRRQKCIFLDRDGTINAYRGFIREPEKLELLDGAAEAIRKINASAYLVIVVTNQPVIARGECSFAQLDEIHAKLETVLGEQGAYLDDILYCPHHPDSGFEGEVAALKFKCGCRKPAPGMLLEAAARYNIDLSASWIIGDTTQDAASGEACGVRSVLVKTGGKDAFDGKYEVHPAFVSENLLDAVERILAE